MESPTSTTTDSRHNENLDLYYKLMFSNRKSDMFIKKCFPHIVSYTQKEYSNYLKYLHSELVCLCI